MCLPLIDKRRRESCSAQLSESPSEVAHSVSKCFLKMGLCSLPFRMPAVVFPSPGSGFQCDPVTGCFMHVATQQRHQTSDYSLPKDPRLWSRDDVACWLQHISSDHGLPTIPSDRFQMNGKALCLMNVDMFVQRVPLGGKLLYKDFQLRLCAAMYAR